MAGTIISGLYGVTVPLAGSASNAVAATATLLAGVYLAGPNASLTNAGTIGGASEPAISIGSGGLISNLPGGLIGGAIFGVRASAPSTVVNQGQILGSAGQTSSTGIVLNAGGTVANMTGGTIAGQEAGIEAFGSYAAAVVNAGTILGQGSAGSEGVHLQSGGAVTNQAGGVIAATGSAAIGVYFYPNGTLVNAGRIVGAGDGVTFGTESYDTAASAMNFVTNAGTIQGSSGDGIDFGQAGTLTNQASGLVLGGANGVYILGSDAAVFNAGSIVATKAGSYSAGIQFDSGGYVSNASSGVIWGNSEGVAALGTVTSTIANDGFIESTAFFGVDLLGGGSVANSGTIRGAQGGVYFGGSAGTVYNSGLIQAFGSGKFSVGVGLDAGGTIVNGATGTISAAIDGIVAYAGAVTVVNAGRIVAPNAVAVTLAAGFTNRLVVDSGAYFNGLVDGGNTIGAAAVSTLELAAGTGTLSGLGTQFTGFSAVDVDPNAAWSLTGSATLAAGAVIRDSGYLSAGSLSGAGSIVLAPNATLTLTGSSGTDSGGIGPGVTFTAGGAQTLIVAGHGGTIATPIAGFGVGDRIEFSGMTVTSAAAGNGTIVVGGGNGLSMTLSNIAGAPGPLAYGVDATTGFGFVEMPCFAEGTRLKTDNGWVPIEDLRVGDILETRLPGTPSPIIWLGSRRVDCSRHPRPNRVWPIRIAAHAFGKGRPVRDLLVSPNHALFLNQVLIPAYLLVNGRSIRQIPLDGITYWHVELARHSVVLAEGIAAESYLDINDRSQFNGHGGPVALHPDFAVLTWEAVGCAPLVVTGPELDAARALLRDAAPLAVLPGR